MKMKPIYDKLERQIITRGVVVDWYPIRDMIDVATGSELGAKTLDRYTQSLVNRLHKSVPHLLAR